MRAQFYVLAAVIILSAIYMTARQLNEGIVVQPSAPSEEFSFSREISTSFQELANESQKNFDHNFNLLRRYIAERSTGAFSVQFDCEGGCPSDVFDVSTRGQTGELNFRFNVTPYRPSRVWWDDNVTDANVYGYRSKIILSENAGVKRDNWPFVITGSELAYAGVHINEINIASIRLVDHTQTPDEVNEVGGNDIPFQLDEKNNGPDYAPSNSVLDSNDEIAFVYNLTAFQTKDLYLYYAKSGTWSTKSYTTDASLDTGVFQNSKYRAEYASDWSMITSLKVDLNGNGYSDDQNMIASFAPVVEGTLTTNPSSGVVINGTIRSVINSAVYMVNSSNFVGNVTRRIVHWAYSPTFELIHQVNGSSNGDSQRLQMEQFQFSTQTWYRCFFPDSTYGPSGGFGTTVVGEQTIPGYLYAVSQNGGAAGFIFTDSPALHQASEVVQWALERGGVDVLSRKAWLRDGYSDDAVWKAWAYLGNNNFTEEPINIWSGFRDPVFVRPWLEETE